MKPLATGVPDFEGLIQGVYVDKTRQLYQLVRDVRRFFFLSRPRRFGKSVTLSTLKAIFQGRRELFRGLAIDSLMEDWKTYPVIYLDLSLAPARTPSELRQSLQSRLEENARPYDLAIHGANPADQFTNLIVDLKQKTQEQVVILIDEYDRPILDNLQDLSLAKQLQQELHDFYAPLKGNSQHERFVLLTGLTQFSKLSIFSVLSNLNILSMDPDYATLCGFTQQELITYFADRIHLKANQEGLRTQEILEKMKLWYDGYRFAPDAENVYNPISISNFLQQHGTFQYYWMETGGSTFMTRMPQLMNLEPERWLATPLMPESFAAFDLEKLNALVLLFQAGYLTIDTAEKTELGLMVTLRFPNLEVRAALHMLLLEFYSAPDRQDIYIPAILNNLKKTLILGKFQDFIKQWNALLAKFDYDLHIPQEKFYQAIFQWTLILLGIDSQSEYHTNNGRIDTGIQTEKQIYLIEFKLCKDAQTAIKQILDKEYYLPFLDSGKKITLIGASFDPIKRQLTDWKIQPLDTQNA